MSTAILRELVRLGGPESTPKARRLAQEATRDIADSALAEELHRLLAERLESMVAAHDLGEALGHDLLADGMIAELALNILDRIDKALTT